MTEKKNSIPASVIKILLLMLPVFFGIFTVARYGVNVFYWDDWEYMRNIDRFLTLDFLWSQHNEHRLLTSKIVAYITGSLTSWNSKAFMYASQMFLALLYLMVIKIYADGRKIGELSFKEIAVCVLTGMYLYNVRQYENLLWAFQTAWFIIISAGTLSFLLFDKYLKKGKKLYLAGAMFCAVAVTYCLMNGLAVWGAYICIMIVSLISKEKLPKEAYIIVSVTGALSVGIYFINWHGIEMHDHLLASGAADIVKYLPKLVFASVISVPNNALAYIMFVLIVFVIIVCAVNDIADSKFIAKIRIYGPEIMAAGILAAISLGRGHGEYIASRYRTDGTFFVAFFLLICFFEVRKHEKNKNDENSGAGAGVGKLNKYVGKICAFFPTVILFMSLASTAVDYPDMADWKTIMETAKYSLVNYDLESEQELTVLYPHIGTGTYENSAERFKEIFKTMEEKGWNTFSEDISDFRSAPVPVPDTAGADELPDIFTEANVYFFGNILHIELIRELDPFISKKALEKGKCVFIINGNAYSSVVFSGEVCLMMPVDILKEGENTVSLYIESDGKRYATSEHIFLYSADIRNTYAYKVSDSGSDTLAISCYYIENDRYRADFGVDITVRNSDLSASVYCRVSDKTSGGIAADGTINSMVLIFPPDEVHFRRINEFAAECSDRIYFDAERLAVVLPEFSDNAAESEFELDRYFSSSDDLTVHKADVELFSYTAE